MTNFRKKIQIPNILQNSISSIASFLVTFAVGLFLTPYIIKRIGDTGYGFWSLIGSYLGFYNLLKLGVDQAVCYFVARDISKSDHGSIDQIVSTALAVFTFLGFLLIILGFLLAPALASYFDVPLEYLQSFKTTFVILTISAAINFPGSVIGAILKGNEKYVFHSNVTIISTLLRVVLIIFWLSHGGGLIQVAYATLISTLVGIFLSVNKLSGLNHQPKVRFDAINHKALESLLKYGVITSFIFLADLLRFNLDTLIIGKQIGPNSVAKYSVAILIVNNMFALVSSGVNVLTPRFAGLRGKNATKELKDVFLQALSLSAWLASGMTVLAFIFGYRFILWWVGEDFAASVYVLNIFLLFFILAAAQKPAQALLYGINRHSFFAISGVGYGIANLMISLALAPQYGIIGVAIGTTVSVSFVKLFIQPVYISRIVGVPLWDYFRNILIPITIAIGFILIAEFIGYSAFLSEKPITFLFVGGIIVSLLFFVIAFVIPGKSSIRPVFTQFFLGEKI
jgi:O-antigen/teichoic acid export membrane protein